ncbi:31K virion structural protein [Callinectes sapidus nudivirus]|nr:31K virion structural protein [Callinectes sapidus nudivirus]
MFRLESTNTCMFNGISQCSRDYINSTKIVCSKHSRDIFALSGRTHKIYSDRWHNKKVLNVSANSSCDREFNLLPFPIKITAAANGNQNYTHNGNTLCVDRENMVTCVSSFIEEKNLTNRGYSPMQTQQIIHTIITYISDSSFHSNIYPYENVALYNYNNFLTNNKNRLTTHWTDQTLIGVIGNNNNYVLFPLIKFPIFYQAMLVNIEISSHFYNNPNGLKTITPNCIFNCDLKMFRTFNQNDELRIFKDIPNTSYATPLVSCGTITHPNAFKYDDFERPDPISGVFSSNTRPPAC